MLREGFNKKNKKNYGIFQSWSDPSQPGNFRPELWKKTKKTKTLKNDLRVMKQILYDMGKKKYFFLIIYYQFLTNTFVREEVGRGGP